MTISDDGLAVLLAEKHEHALTSLKGAIEETDTVDRVMCVRDGEEARAYLRGQLPYANRNEHPLPGLLILGHHLPTLDGLDLLRWVRRQARFDRLPVVVWTVFEPGQEFAVQRLNAAPCASAGERGEMSRSLGRAIVRALRLASLVPDVAWYRGVGPAPDLPVLARARA